MSVSFHHVMFSCTSCSDHFQPLTGKLRSVGLPLCTKSLAVYDQRIVQELCESRGGRPVLSVLTSLLVSVDVKIYCTMLRHWSQLVPNMSHDI